MNDSFYIEQLRAKLKTEMFPEELNSYTCAVLSDKILQKTKKRISASTLQRLMNFVPSKSAISVSTLNIVSEFIDFEGWENFKSAFENEKQPTNEKVLPDYYGLKLLEIACKNHDFKTVLDYLKILPLENYSLQRQMIGEIIGNIVRHDLKARNILLPELAKTPQGRFYFYESFVDLDFLPHYYANSLDYYKKHINQQDQKSALRDEIFATSIQFLNQLLLQNKIGAVKKGYELNKLTEKKEINLENIGHILPLTRYKTTMLSYWFLTNQSTNIKCDKYLESLETELESCVPFTRTFILAETFRALAIGNRYADIKYLFDKYASYPIAKIVPGQYQLVLSLAQKSYKISGEKFLFDGNKIAKPKRTSKDYTKVTFQ